MADREQGAQAGWQPPYVLGGLTDADRREFRNPIDVSDIVGALAGTRRFAPVTKRATHPLDPDYTALDGAMLLMRLSGCAHDT